MIMHAQARQMELARRHVDYWTLAQRQDRNWIALATVVAGVAGTLGIAIGTFLL